MRGREEAPDAMPARKPILFISYAHADEPERPGPEEVQWLSFVTGYLRPALKHGAVDIWVDQMMEGGADWEREIATKLRACDIFVLLVSRHSMSSDYVVDKEIAIIRERQAKGEDVHFYPLLLTPTPKIGLDRVRDKNLRPRDAKPFSGFSLHERYARMSEAADEIAEIAAFISHPRGEVGAGLTFKRENATEEVSSEITDRVSLESWLKNQSFEVAVTIAARAALRAAPSAASAAPSLAADTEATQQFAKLTSAIFRAISLSRAAGKYPERANELRLVASSAVISGDFPAAEVPRAAAAADAAAKAAAAGTTAAAPRTRATEPLPTPELQQSAPTPRRRRRRRRRRAQYVLFAADAVDNAASDATTDHRASWAEIRADIVALRKLGPAGLSDAALWSVDVPPSIISSLSKFREALPKNEHWDIWLDWYRDRLEGVSRSEAYELVFATVPLDVWKQGPAAANAWIAEHLPKNAPTLDPDGFPKPIPDLPTPFAYSWNPYQRVAIVAGLQNLPFFPHFKSEEEHRQVLEACRVGAERLLKMLVEGHFHNVGPLYAPTLRNYLDDLPKTAGNGSILLSHDEALHLRSMFLADADVLPAAFASRLSSIISNQFALNGFYDLVQRHNEAVASAKWTQPFPTDAARQFFHVVAENTPKFFEPEVADSARRIEGANEGTARRIVHVEVSEKVIVRDHAEAGLTGTSVENLRHIPGSTSAPQPPPLPAGSPDPKHSAEHQVATSANALWEVFLKGKDLPLAVEGWSRVAHALGDAIGPILEFLKNL